MAFPRLRTLFARQGLRQSAALLRHLLARVGRLVFFVKFTATIRDGCQGLDPEIDPHHRVVFAGQDLLGDLDRQRDEPVVRRAGNDGGLDLAGEPETFPHPNPADFRENNIDAINSHGIGRRLRRAVVGSKRVAGPAFLFQ